MIHQERFLMFDAGTLTVLLNLSNFEAMQETMNRPLAFNPLRNVEQMAALISAVTGESADRVKERLEQERLRPGSSVCEDFKKTGGQPYTFSPKLEAFYSATDAFLYELAVWNRNRLKSSMRRWTARYLARQGKPLDLLSIGDGLGFDCLHFSRKQHRVTYFELPGLSERFAHNLFQQSGVNISILTDPASIPHEAYDAITCFDVLEHVPDVPAFVRMLSSYLRPGGLLYVSAPFCLILPWYPTHLKQNRRFCGSLDLYKQAGFNLAGGKWTWDPIVLQKPVKPNDSGSPLSGLPVRLGAAFQRVGRYAAWPFAGMHYLRKLCDQPFEAV